MLLAIGEETETGTGKSGQGTRECRLPEILLNFNRIQRVCPGLAVSEAVSAACLWELPHLCSSSSSSSRSSYKYMRRLLEMYPEARLWIKNNQAQGIRTHMDNIYKNIWDTPSQRAFDLRAELFLIYLVSCSSSSSSASHRTLSSCCCYSTYALCYSPCSTCGCSCSLCQSIAQFFALSRALSKQPRATWPRLVCVQAAPAACIANYVPGIYYRFASLLPCNHNIMHAYGESAA